MESQLSISTPPHDCFSISQERAVNTGKPFKAVVFPEKAQWGNRSSLTLLPSPPVTQRPGGLATLVPAGSPGVAHLLPYLPSHHTSSHSPGSTMPVTSKLRLLREEECPLFLLMAKAVDGQPESSVVSSSAAVDPRLRALSEPPKRSERHRVLITLKTSTARS